MPRVSTDHYIDCAYQKYMQTKRGQKIIELCCLLTEASYTKKALVKKMKTSASEARELLKILIQEHYITYYKRIGGIHWRRGRPSSDSDVDNQLDEGKGRPPKYYSLTADGRFLVRFDPRIANRWFTTEAGKSKLTEQEPLDSYANLEYAIRADKQFRKFGRAQSLMSDDLEGLILNRFVLGYDPKEIPYLYNALVKIMKENVPIDYLLSYYIALERNLQELSSIEKRTKLLMEKMSSLPTIQTYIERNKK
jgi:hypothetical protein